MNSDTNSTNDYTSYGGGDLFLCTCLDSNSDAPSDTAAANWNI